MTILDSFAVLALLKGEPAAADVRRLIGEGSCTLTVLGVAEVVDHLVRIVGISEEDAALDLAQLGLADAEPLGSTVALRAGLLRARHYNSQNRAISLADCVAAETARTNAHGLATADPHLLETCRDEAIDVVVLPDSRGEFWQG